MKHNVLLCLKLYVEFERWFENIHIHTVDIVSSCLFRDGRTVSFFFLFDSIWRWSSTVQLLNCSGLLLICCSLWYYIFFSKRKEKKRNSSRALQQNTKAEKRWCVETEGMKEAITQVLYVWRTEGGARRKRRIEEAYHNASLLRSCHFLLRLLRACLLAFPRNFNLSTILFGTAGRVLPAHQLMLGLSASSL